MIGGNILGTFQIYTTYKNEIGEHIKEWVDCQTVNGFLDMQSGDSNYTYDSKISESTNIFITDFVKLDSRIKAETSRMLINGEQYNITYIDNPMNLNKQLEVYLKYTGGQTNGN